ncbi:MAG: NAD(+)--dinitrogen-reductase ADP-D-ribosyltransferase [Proteobacteria bacterium]|nr:NAD(+)--dinitrogen-reductase ADP-D-ribosyltransferase [Pseudomonadota bacterium]
MSEAALPESLRAEHPAVPLQWYCGNLVGIPTTLLGSALFNSQPTSMTIHGTRESHTGLFKRLAGCASQTDAAHVFEHYMDLQFGHNLPEDDEPGTPRRFSTSYIELLRGWGFDSNSPQGAVLKGWVESRFGLIPTFHKEPLRRFPSAAWVAYLEEKACSRFHNNGINFQLDVLYEYCQWSIQRFGPPERNKISLWRGTNNGEEQVVEGSLQERLCTMRLNNLVSFSVSEERAEEFGDWILQTDVPLSKIVFFPGILSDPVLNSENEYIVIGGNYTVRAWHGYL